MTAEEINKKYGYWAGNILKLCHTCYIGDIYIPQSEPCDIWYTHELKIGNCLLEALKPNSNFIDIGANFGYFTLLAANIIKTGKIYAIDPNPYVFSILGENVALRKLKNVELYNRALSDSNKEELEFYWRDGANGNGRSYNPSQYDKNLWKTHKVKTITLDDFANKDIDLIKMDIEGAEYEVLHNADIICTQNKKVKIILELHEQYITERLGIDEYNNFIFYLYNKFDAQRIDKQFVILETKNGY